MRPLVVLFGIFLALAAVAAPAKEKAVEIETAPLSWTQAGLMEGSELYSELCAVCHGVAGKGDGPAAPALVKGVPDLTTLASDNLGVFPRDAVEAAITGRTRIVAHGTVDMPLWGKAFADALPAQKHHAREGLARRRIHNLTAHLESLQAD